MINTETRFLLAVERGEMEKLERFLRDRAPGFTLNINCRDPLERDALTIAIDNQSLDIIRLLLKSEEICVCDALLYAIQKSSVEAVELLLGHSSLRNGWSPCNGGGGHNCNNNFYTCDMTPLMLAAQKNNLEIIKLLLDCQISPPIPYPHEPRCGCDSCRRARTGDCLKHSRARINAYKALASPSLMALSSSDPLASAFEMSAKLEDLAQQEPEYKEEYMRLRAQCQEFATKLLGYTRTSEELEVLLNFDGQPKRGDKEEDQDEDNVIVATNRNKRQRLARLKMAIRCKQKTFCAHPDVQEFLATMWYENLPGFRRKNIIDQTLQVVCIGLMFPIYSIAYLLAPQTQFGSYIKKPFIKFICHSASYITFIIVLILASQRMEAFYEWSSVLSLFISNTNQADHYQLLSNLSLQLVSIQQQHQQSSPNSYNGTTSGLNANNNNNTYSIWRATFNAPPPTPTGSYGFDDAEINQLAALYRHTMGATSGAGGGGASSTARGLDSLSRIFEQLPASSKKRGTLPSPIESVILIWVLSLIWAELKQIRALGMNYYKEDMWNILDSIASSCYIGTVILRIISYLQSDSRSLEVAREHWHAYDPTLLSEGLFATATIFSSLKLVYIFSVNPYLGPLQISLGRMIIDILRFSWIYMLVLFAFACGMNQLLWYYADLERHQCLNVTNYNLAQYYKAKHSLSFEDHPAGSLNTSLASNVTATTTTTTTTTNATSILNGPASLNLTSTKAQLDNSTDSIMHTDWANMTDENLMESYVSASFEDDSSMPPVTIDDSCKTWRHFSNVFESSQTLFWANFGLVDLENFDLTGIRQYTRFWALLMFGCYCFINVIVVLNLLIAMMNHSYVKISKRSDIEWKFARTRLWVSYFETGSTVPAPFNIIPTFKSIRYCLEALSCRLQALINHLSGKRGNNSAKLEIVEQSSVKLARYNVTVRRERRGIVVCTKRKTGELNYDLVIRALVRRYMVSEQRKLEEKSGRPLTEAKLERWSRLRLFD